ncbi:hypothetical protein MN116_002861 [Schistosoma mekongi]|uniref:peptidylprolyl isomerase n=1 Tax=Schistosoma mekongi TaxID=38744 RepID=A0AAE2D6Q2_SCHME|nr:hypothetical protein MN116_002861 [Schistosoma mekongi]
MGRRKGPKHDHQLQSPNVEHSTEELIAESSISENSDNASTTKSPDLEVTACSAETIDVLGNGLVVIKTLVKGLGRETRPNHGDTVVINYKGWLEDGTLVDDVENAKIVLGDGDVIHAFDLSVPLAEHKETFELITDARFAYGSRGRDPDIPSGAKLTYRIEILEVDDPPCYANMPNSERLAIANQKKDRGNYYYRREEFAFAIDSYSKALKILQLPMPSTQSSGEKSDADFSTELINDTKLKLENNLAAAQLKVEAFDAAIMSCDTVLQSDPRNIKALFRKGKVSCVLFALLEMNEVDDAIPILQKVLTLAPGSQMASVELARARAVRQKEREHWSRSVNRRFPKTKQDKNTKLSTLSKVKLVMSSRFMVVTSIVAILSVLIGLFTYIYQPTIMNFNT